jgi:hypothetical protein
VLAASDVASAEGALYARVPMTAIARGLAFGSWLLMLGLAFGFARYVADKPVTTAERSACMAKSLSPYQRARCRDEVQ